MGIEDSTSGLDPLARCAERVKTHWRGGRGVEGSLAARMGATEFSGAEFDTAAVLGEVILMSDFPPYGCNRKEEGPDEMENVEEL